MEEILKVLFIVCISFHWSLSSNEGNIPEIPAGHRAEYYLQNEDGGYQYGTDTGIGAFAKQQSNAANEVEGHFGHSLGESAIVDIKYVSGINRYQPEGSVIPEILEDSIQNPKLELETPESTDISSDEEDSITSNDDDSTTSDDDESDTTTTTTTEATEVPESNEETDNGDNNEKENESSENKDEVEEEETSTEEESENTDIDEIGTTASPDSTPTETDDSVPSEPTSSSSVIYSDGSYDFSYLTDNSYRKESRDKDGDVNGEYSYVDENGNRVDLLYKAGPDTGFVVTGGSLGILATGLRDVEMINQVQTVSETHRINNPELSALPEFEENGDSYNTKSEKVLNHNINNNPEKLMKEKSSASNSNLQDYSIVHVLYPYSVPLSFSNIRLNTVQSDEISDEFAKYSASLEMKTKIKEEFNTIVDVESSDSSNDGRDGKVHLNFDRLDLYKFLPLITNQHYGYILE